MMEKEDISTLVEKKMETCEENAESSRTSKQLCNIFLCLSLFPLKDCLSFSIFFLLCLSILLLFYNLNLLQFLLLIIPLLCQSNTPSGILTMLIFSLVFRVLYMEYIKPILMIQVTFMLSWMSSTQYSLYLEDINHNDQFHSTILTKCCYIN